MGVLVLASMLANSLGLLVSLRQSPSTSHIDTTGLVQSLGQARRIHLIRHILDISVSMGDSYD